MAFQQYRLLQKISRILWWWFRCLVNFRGTRWRSWLMHCRFHSRSFIDINLPAELWPWGWLSLLTEIITVSSSWGIKAAGAQDNNNKFYFLPFIEQPTVYYEDQLLNIYCERHMNHVSALCGQNAVLFNVKARSQPVSLCGNLCAVNHLILTEYRNWGNPGQSSRLSATDLQPRPPEYEVVVYSLDPDFR